MMNWILSGFLASVLTAEVLDAWALRQLTVRCLGIQDRTPADRRLVRWYAEGFEHSQHVAAWLRAASVALTVVCIASHAHVVLIAMSLALAVGAHFERSFSAQLRRRYFQAKASA